ncbi:MAG: hypothetical protein KC940_21035, partial [Candidatus Omnitrophica bacterium]|nr:hypothetical protein [Candidatus Omnitrophota bacterium]
MNRFNKKNGRLLQRLFVLLAFVSVLCPNAFPQEDEDSLTRELEARAERVTREFPWLVQTNSGLSITAYGRSREEILRGLNAATDLVFDGTENLDPVVDLAGNFSNVEEALKKLCRDDPYLKCRVDFSTSSAHFDSIPDPTANMSNIGLISRYHQVRIDTNLTRQNYGMFLPGMLVCNGSQFPAPFNFQIEPIPLASRVVVKVNGYSVEDFQYSDPVELDRNLYQAANVDELKSAIQAKLDQTWRMSARFPYGTTRETLGLLSQQAQFLYGVVRSEPMIRGLRLHLNDGQHLDWTFPKQDPTIAFDGADAYQKAQQYQQQAISGLSSGLVVFLSNRFGLHILEDSLNFPNRIGEIAAADASLGEKENRIRTEWPDDADWVLEFFYTSLIPEDWIDSPPVQTELIPNSDTLGPVYENPAQEKIQESMREALDSPETPILPPDLTPLEMPTKGRGLFREG